VDLFFQPKICWKAVGRNLAFSIVDKGIFLTAPASFISANNDNETILAYLCSKVAKYYIYQNSDTTGAGDVMLNIQSLIKFPIPKIGIPELTNLILKKDEIGIDKYIYKIYGFNKEEIKFIESI
jgi:hypothetical protein